MSRWSVDDRSHRPLLRQAARTAGIGLLGGALALTAVAGTAAQATPAVGSPAPASGPCAAPAGASGSALVATPGAGMAMATPEAAAAPAATPGDAALHDEAVAAATNLANCWNAGDLDGVFGAVTPRLLQTKFGVPDKATAEAALADQNLPLYTILEAGPAATYDDGRASLELVYLLGDHQYTHARWYMVRDGGALLVDEEELLRPEPEGDTTTIGFSIADDTSPVAFDQSTEIPAAPVVILHGVNNGAERHVFTIVRLDAGGAGTPAATPVAGAMPQGEFIGQLSLGAGEQKDLALLAIEPGSYLLLDPAVAGSSATLTVTQPSS